MKTKGHIKPYFKAQVKDNNELEMLVYDVIGEAWDGSGITAKSFKDQLDNSGSYDRISVRINSPGGDVFDGVAIYNLLRAQGKPVSVYVDGLAASSASIIAMAGDEIVMGTAALLMIHEAWSLAIGDADDMRKMGETLDTVTGSIADIYVLRTGNDLADIKQMMKDETWLNSADALAAHFCTAVSKQSAGGVGNAVKHNVKALSKYRNVPAELKITNDTNCECPCESCDADDDCSSCTNADCGPEQGCTACPMQIEDSNLSLYEARLALLKLKRAA
jgi:ATP-dependent Clp protease protease subunit